MRSARGSLRELTENVSRLRAQLRELEIQAETQMQSRFSTTPEQTGGKFDPLEFDRFTRLQELTRLMAESVNDVATVQHSLARDLDEALPFPDAVNHVVEGFLVLPTQKKETRIRRDRERRFVQTIVFQVHDCCL